MKLSSFFGLTFLCLALLACSRNEMRGIMDITFRVEAPGLDTNATVYIVGDHYMLGDWDPGAMPLSYKGEQIWELKLGIPYGARIQYKFTLGSWKSEELTDQGQPPPNHQLAATRSYTLSHKINLWRTDASSSDNITGEVRYHRGIGNDQVSPRDIIVWLPPDYETSAESYPVLYAHDGQNLFDPSTSFIGADWNVDATANRLIREGHMKPVIIVGIYNTPQRMDEYGFGETGKAYRNFVIQIVKPLIDSTYRTLPDRDNTATMGSSMGGLVSFLLAWDHPETFRQAACLSPAFFPEVVDRVRIADTAPLGMRIYMDNGTEGMEQRIQFFCDDMMDVLPGKGFHTGVNFEWYLDRGAEHNEHAWAARVHRPLLFMFGTDSTAIPTP